MMLWEDQRRLLQCYDDGKLVNHRTITLQLKHYAKDSFQDHQFFIVKTPTQKEIIVGHPVSVRLGLIQVLCENHAKTVSSIETEQTNNLFQVHNIDGKTRHDWQEAVLRPRAVEGANQSHFKTLFQDPSPSQVRMSTKGLKWVPFKTLNIKKSTHTVTIITYEANLAHFRTIIHDDERRNDKIRLISRPLIQNILKRVKELNPEILFAD